jgi:hypothetical protein
MVAPALAGTAKTPTQKLQSRMRNQSIRISRDLTAGKLTADQAKTLKSRLKAIRQEEIADLQQNDSKVLTPEQLSLLNGKLDALSKEIPIP